MAGVVGLQQLMRMQGIEWGDSGRGGGDAHFYADGLSWNSDVLVNMPLGFTITPANQIGTTLGLVALGSTGTTIKVPDNTTSINFLTVLQNFAGTTNAPNGNSARGIYVENHWTDNTNGVATTAAIYGQVYNDATTTIVDEIGLTGRAYVTSTGVVTNMDGVYGSVGFSGAGTVTYASSIHAKDPPVQTAAAVITNLIGVRVDAGAVATILPVNYYGIWLLASPSGASTNNIGILVGPTPTGTNTAAVYIAPSSGTGLIVGTGGIVNLLSGFITTGAAPAASANTTAASATIAIAAGDNGAANTTLCAVYYYRGSAVAGYTGFDNDATVVIAGHTKGVTDYVIAPGGTRRMYLDTNGSIWAKGLITCELSVTTTQRVSTSATPAAMLIMTGAAHTTLVNAEVNDVNFAFSRTVQFTGSATLATQRSFIINAPTFTSDTATKAITAATTVAILGPPVAGTNVTLTAPNTSILWLGSGIATVAGGALAAAIAIGVTASVPSLGLYWGSGAPTIAAPQGSLYLNTTGSSTSTRLYVNTTGATTWTNVTTAA